MVKERNSFIEPSFKRLRELPMVDGVRFHSYHVGIMSYARISEDGQIKVWWGNTHRGRDDRAPTYYASVIGHGDVNNEVGNRKRFRSEDAACRAAVKILKEIRPWSIPS